MTHPNDEETKPKLTSAEIASLWSNYVNFSLSERIFEHFAMHVEMPQVDELIEDTRQDLKKHLITTVGIFNEAALPIPIGFTANDLNPKAPRLFDDEYYIQNIMNFSQVAMNELTYAIGVSARSDVYDLFSNTLASMNVLHRKAVNIAQNLGVYVRAPIVPFPYKADYVKDESFMSPGLLGKKKRPPLASEISQLHFNIIHNTLGSMTLTAFSQVAKEEDIRNFFLKGIKLAEKQIADYSKLLLEFQIPIPSFPNSLVTDSNLIPPFSDKLMLYEAVGMTAVGLSALGNSLIHTVRMDIHSTFTKFAAEIALYSKEGMELTIRKGWAEHPPEAADRKALAAEERKGE